MIDRSRVSVVHDYLTQRGGAERVALELAKHYGGALTTSVHAPESTFEGFDAVQVREVMPRLPDRLKTTKFMIAPFVALAFLFRVIDSPTVLCSSSGWSHWVRTTGRKVVYCYSPPRWLYAEKDYFHGRNLLGFFLTVPLFLLRRVDRRFARGATEYLAISRVSADRVRLAYGREATIVPPPVTFDVSGDREPIAGLRPGFFLTIARPRGYKNVDVAIDAFREGKHGVLAVVGGANGRALDSDSPVVQLGRVSEAELRWLYENCQATIGLSREDFGLTPVEGHLFGKPAIVVAAGGYLETCEEGVNAVFIPDASADSLRNGLLRLKKHRFNEATIKSSAEQFSPASFFATLDAHLTEKGRSCEFA